jgi:hypothetical protein
MSDSLHKSVRMPDWNGKKETYQEFGIRFGAFGYYHGWSKSIGTKQDPDLPDKEMDSDDPSCTKEQKKALLRNAGAMANYTMALPADMMGVVHKSKSVDWPNGLAWKVTEQLEAQFAPRDLASKTELRVSLNQVKMGKKEDPRKLFEKLAGIETRFNTATYQIPKDELMAVVMQKAPDIYDGAINMEMRSKGDALTMEDLQTTMCNQYRITASKTGAGTDDQEIGLVAPEGRGIKCYNCQKFGHKAFQCTEEKKERGNTKTKFKGKCDTCGKQGHKAETCWKDPANADKMPGWLKKKNAKKNGETETGMAGVELTLAATCVLTQDEATTAKQDWDWCDDMLDDPYETEWVETTMMGVMMHFPMLLKFLEHPNVWVGDTAASCDSTPHKTGLVKITKATSGVGIENGNGSMSQVEGSGELHGTVCDKTGTEVGDVNMTDVRWTPGNKYNLFSISKRLKDGWKMTGDSTGMVLKKGNAEVKFDLIIPTHKGVIFAIYIKRQQVEEVAGIGTTKMRLNIGRAHELLGHMGEDMTRKAAKHLGWEITKGVLKTCESCAIGKAKQKNVPKKSEHVVSKKNGERLFLDITSMTGEKDGIKPNEKKNWRILVDERTQMKFSLFSATKDGMVVPTLEHIGRMNKNGMTVKYIRLDNAGENVKLQKVSNSKDYKMNLKFEFTARNTPQQNHLSELGFTVLYNRGRSMMHRANIPKEVRYKVFPKVFETATLLDGLTICTIDGETKTRVEHFTNELPKFAKHLRTWGEAGTVTIKKKMQPKLIDRGVTCMFVGYAADHEGDCYIMWNPATKRVYTTRDIIWLNRFFYTKAQHDVDDDDDLVQVVAPDTAVRGELDADADNVTAAERTQVHVSWADQQGATRKSTRLRFPKDRYEAGTSGMESYVTKDDDDDDEDETEDQEQDPDQEADQEEDELDESEMSAWLSEVDVDLTPAEDKFYAAMRGLNEYQELGLIGAGIGGGFVHTSELKVMKFNEAMAGPNKKEWEKAVEEEHNKFKQYGVFETVKVEDVPTNAKL